MNEIALSNDLNVITAEINSYKQVAGQAIFEIGKRLKHVKENDLVHGEWGEWCESIGVSRSQTTKFITVYENLYSDGSTWNHLGTQALYLIATLPVEEREKKHTIPSTNETKTVDEMTVRELREVKKALKQSEQEKQRIAQLLTEERNKQPEVIEKEVVPRNIQDQLKEKDRFLKAVKKEAESLQEELRILKLNNYDDHEDGIADKKLKRLEREASIETLELAVSIQRFLKDASLTAFQVGALAQASESVKKKMYENVELLENFSQNIKTALNGRIQI